MAWKRPELSLVACRAVPPFATSVILTAAPGMRPPDASMTVPLIFCDCAIIGCAANASRIVERMVIFTLLPLLTFIEPSRHTCVKNVFRWQGANAPAGSGRGQPRLAQKQLVFLVSTVMQIY